MDRPQIKTAPAAAGRASIWKNYLLLIYTVAAFGAILIVAEAIISNHNARLDLTPGRRFSLSEFDRRVLGGLEHNVKVMAFVRVEDPTYLDLSDIAVSGRRVHSPPDA